MRFVPSAALLVALHLSSPANAAEGPVVVLGLDAATFDVIDPLVARGELPNLASLMETGARATLRSERPIRSPALWTTIATGQPRQVHGIYDFVTGSDYWPKTMRGTESQLVTSDMRRSRALWQYASDGGLDVLIVGWLNSWPAEKVKGVMVAPYVALGKHKQTSIKGKIYKDAKDQTYPRELFRQLAPKIVSPDAVPESLVRRIVDPPPSGDPLYRSVPKLERYLYTVRWTLASALTNLAVLDDQLAKNNPRLVMSFFDGSDTLAHRFWLFRQPLDEVRSRLERHGIDPNLAPELKRRFGAAVDNYYRFIDERIGALRKRLPRDSTFIVLSDHGFGTYPKARAIHSSTPFDGQHTLGGVFIAAGPGIRRGAQIQDVLVQYDVVPTLLYRLGLPVPEELPGKVAEGLFEKRYTRAHAIGRRSKGETARGATNTPTQAPFAGEELERLRSLGYVQ